MLLPHPGRALRSACPRPTGILLLLSGLLLVPGLLAPVAAREAITADDLERLISLGDIPGASLAVLEADTVAAVHTAGVRNSRIRRAVDRETVFEAASLSKTVFAYTVLRLVDRGLLTLDEPLVRHAPYPRLAGDPRHRRVTARMCLTHTTGLPNWGTRFVAEPGTRFTYSGEGIRFLRKTAEAVTGLPLEELVRREVFEPLGMTRSSYLFGREFAENAATGHDRSMRPQPRRRSPSGSAAASLHTTARDYARFLSACLRGEGLSAAMRAEMLTPQIQAELGAPADVAEHVHWGLGWGLMDGPHGEVVWQWGDNGDTVALAAGCPGCGAGVVYLANGATGLSVAHELVDAAMPAHHPWCLVALDYQRYDGPRRVRWFEQQARRSLAAGELTRATLALQTLLELRPGHPWAADLLGEVQEMRAERSGRDSGHG